VPYEFDTKSVDIIKKKLKLTDGKSVIQKESYFRDIVKMEIGDNTHYCKKQTTGQLVNNMLIQNIKFNVIEECQFPNLTKYDYVSVKHMDIYEDDIVNIIFIDNDHKNEKWQMCLDIKVIDDKKINNIINKINELFDNSLNKNK
jgi:hypothetical protein